jgi:hypothetical protein
MKNKELTVLIERLVEKWVFLNIKNINEDCKGR